MQRPSGQFAVVVIILVVVEIVGVEPLAGWHPTRSRRSCRPRCSAILNHLIDIVINFLEVVEIALDSGFDGGPFLRLTTATAATSAAASASAAFVLVLTGLRSAP